MSFVCGFALSFFTQVIDKDAFPCPEMQVITQMGGDSQESPQQAREMHVTLRSEGGWEGVGWAGLGWAGLGWGGVGGCRWVGAGGWVQVGGCRWVGGCRRFFETGLTAFYVPIAEGQLLNTVPSKLVEASTQVFKRQRCSCLDNSTAWTLP